MLSLGLAGAEPGPGVDADDPRGLLSWAASQGLPAVSLNVAAPGFRPRELDRSARRDLAATLRRLGLRVGGLDLWIPPEHFADPAKVDRAVEAVRGAVGLSADLASAVGDSRRPVVSVGIAPSAPLEVVRGLDSAGERAGVLIADHTWPRPDGRPDDLASLGAGIDPAAVLAGGGDPVASINTPRPRLHAARLSDLGAGGRLWPGARGARLPLDAYAAGLIVAGVSAPVTLDLRGLRDQAAGIAAAHRAWQGALGIAGAG
jgi:sugar phosphate isomerase/epimerase